jgi:UDP-N-acetylmuramoyl-tripeptide--D-alanyl-D-alanine ligase
MRENDMPVRGNSPVLPDGEGLLFTAGEAASLLGCGFRGDVGARIHSVVADSRSVRPGSLFVALGGERSDGHDYLASARESGASCFLVRADRSASVPAALSGADGGAAVLFVDDTLKALQSLALIHRRRHAGLLRIGITGSSGKTTTKECVASILGRGKSLVMNPGNLNSDIGLPLSMFLIAPGHEIGVFEMGMNRPGEIGELARIFEPDIALICNVGTAHIGILGSRDAIAKEKKDIFSFFSGAQRGFVWEDDDYRFFLNRDVAGRVEDFGERSTPGFVSARSAGLAGHEIEWKDRIIRFPLPGKHNLLDALAAISVALAAGATDDDIVAGLEAVRPLFGRSEILRGEITLVRDCYNSNPDSAEAVLDFCDSVETVSRKIYVLGSMLELGPESGRAHEHLGARAGMSKAAMLFFFGADTEAAAAAARESGFPGILWQGSDIVELKAAIRSCVCPGDTVLLKGSRGIALERIVECLPGFAPGEAAVSGQKDGNHAA